MEFLCIPSLANRSVDWSALYSAAKKQVVYYYTLGLMADSSSLCTTSYGFIPTYIPIPVVIGNVGFHNQVITVNHNTTVAGYPPPQGLSHIQPDH